MNEYIQVFMTIDDKGGAERIARRVLKERLAACVQILGPIRSLYRWKGGIEEGQEWLCIMKSSRGLYEALEGTIRAEHPYEVAEILAVAVAAGNPEYLAWLGGALTAPDEPQGPE